MENMTEYIIFLNYTALNLTDIFMKTTPSYPQNVFWLHISRAHFTFRFHVVYILGM